MLDFIGENQNKAIQSEKDKFLSQIAKRVAHDIRSPLATLNMILKLIPIHVEEKNRLLIRETIKRVDNIAKNLLNRYRAGDTHDEIYSNKHALVHIFK